MSVTQTVDIPASRRLVIDVPPEVPPGRTILTFTPAPVAADSVRESEPPYLEEECPLCAKSHTPNAETAAAIREGRAMMRGEIPAKRFKSVAEMFEDLDRDDGVDTHDD